jgi:hypothetical protein
MQKGNEVMLRLGEEVGTGKTIQKRYESKRTARRRRRINTE